MFLLLLYICLGFFIISAKKKSAPKLSYVLSHLKILVYSNLPELMFANSLCIIFSLSLIKLHWATVLFCFNSFHLGPKTWDLDPEPSALHTASSGESARTLDQRAACVGW